jgi:AraC family ethanolamine operon transcriptional activator
MMAAGAAGVTELPLDACSRQARDADLDQVAGSIRGWETRLTQLAAGHGRGSLFETVSPSAHLIRLVFEASVALDALPLAVRPDELFHIGTIPPESEPPLWQGLSVRPDVLMLEEGEVPSSFVLPPGCELLVARLDRTRIESLTRALGGAEDEPAIRRTQIHPQPAPVLAELRSQLRALVRGELAGHSELIGSAEADLYERVASMLAAPPVPLRPSPESRRRGLRRACEYLEAHAGERISLSDVCMAAECCERTLRQAFRECYGTSPMAFLKKLRLQGLRQDLRDAVPHTATVLELAWRWGFWHMGHLGREYRSLFGETPGETLGLARSWEDGGKVSTAPSKPAPRRPPEPDRVRGCPSRERGNT